MLRTMYRWWSDQVAIHKLNKLDDRLLADMGLDRADIARRIRQKSPDQFQPVKAAAPGIFKNVRILRARFTTAR